MQPILSAIVIVVVGSSVVADESGTPITALAITPSGDTISGGQSGISDDRFRTELSHVHDLAFSPDGRWLLSAGGVPAESGGIELHSIADSNATRRYLELTADVAYSAAWSPDGGRVVVGSLDGTCLVLRADSGDIDCTIRGHSRGVVSVIFVTDDLIATASLDHTIRVWDVETGDLKRTLKNHTAPVTSLTLRPGNESALPMLASISRDRTVRLWQPTIGRMVRFVRLDSPPLSVAWTPDGSQLLAACRDGDVRVIDPDTVEITNRLEGIGSHAWCLAPMRDGRMIVVGGGGGQMSVIELPDLN